MPNIPFQDLKTNRLHLRRPLAADLDMLFFLRTDAEVNAYVKRSGKETVEDTKAFLSTVNKGIEKGEWFFWSIAIDGSTEVIGNICLWHFSENKDVAEVGYSLAPIHQQKGLMQEALEAVIQFSFQTLSLRKLEAITHHGNQTSISLLLRNGFTLNEKRSDPDVPHNIIFELKKGEALH